MSQVLGYACTCRGCCCLAEAPAVNSERGGVRPSSKFLCQLLLSETPPTITAQLGSARPVLSTYAMFQSPHPTPSSPPWVKLEMGTQRAPTLNI